MSAARASHSVALSSLRGRASLRRRWIVLGPGPHGVRRRLDRSRWPTTRRQSHRRAARAGARPSLIERGEYLTHAADCVACHTAQRRQALCRRPRLQAAVRHDVFDQHHAGQGNRHRQLHRPAISRRRAQGIRRDGAHLYPAMSYTSYTYMTDADALAIKAYLFSLPPVHAPRQAEQACLAVQPARPDGGSGIVVVQCRRRVSRPTRRRARNGTGAPIWRRRWPLRRMPHAAQSRLCARQPAQIRRRPHRGLARLSTSPPTRPRGLGNWSDDDLATYLSTGHADGHGGACRPDGRSRRQQPQPV